MMFATGCVVALALCPVTEALPVLHSDILCLAQLGARRLRQRDTSDLVELLGEAAVQRHVGVTTVPAPAPVAASALSEMTTASPSETTIFSPEARLGAEWSDYENEMNFGRPNINASASMNITLPMTTGVPLAAAASTTIMVQPAAAPTETDETFRNESALDCVVGVWTMWADCKSSTGDGLRSWHEVRYRPITNPHQLGGLTCLPQVMRRPCPKGGWNSAKSYYSYSYGPGGTSDGLPGGASADDAANAVNGASADGTASGAASACNCGSSLLGVVVEIGTSATSDQWEVGPNETMSLLRQSRTAGRLVGGGHGIKAQEASKRKACLCSAASDS